MTVMYYQMPDGEPVANVKTLLPNVSNPQNLPDSILNMLGVARVSVTYPQLEWWQQRGEKVIDASTTIHEMTWDTEARDGAEVRQRAAARSAGDPDARADLLAALAQARILAGDERALSVATADGSEPLAMTPADALEWAKARLESDYLEEVAALAAVQAAGDESVAVGTIVENDELKDWEPPQGAHDALPLGAIRRHLGDVWLSLLDNNVWEPGQAGWRNISTPQAGQYEPWSPPSGADGNKYMISSRVTHSDKNWESLINNNVWEPGAPGSEALWKEID